MNILYLGLFRFPEGDAAASRILNNARLFRDLGHTVKILSLVENIECKTPVQVDIFTMGYNMK